LKKLITLISAGIFAIGTSVAFAQAPKGEAKGAANADVKADAKSAKAKADTKAEAKSDKATPATPASATKK
jgi:hypothetical protein